MTKRSRFYQQDGAGYWRLWMHPVHNTTGYDWAGMRRVCSKARNYWYPPPEGLPTAEERTKLAVLALVQLDSEVDSVDVAEIGTVKQDE